MLCYAKSLQSCPTLCDPIDGSLPGSPVPGCRVGTGESGLVLSEKGNPAGLSSCSGHWGIRVINKDGVLTTFLIDSQK